MDIKSLIKDKNYVQIKKILGEMNIIQISELLDELDISDVIVVFRLMPKDESAEVFAYLNTEQQEYIINTITDTEMAHILEELSFDDMIDIIEEMPSNLVKKILKNTKLEERHLINQFLNYPEYSAGSIMTIEYVDLKKNMSAKQAIERIRRIGLDKETIHTCYVTDEERKLEGIISLRTLITISEDTVIGDVMTTNFVSVQANDDQEDVALVFKKYDISVIPVLDAEGRLVGIITFDDIMDVIDQENTEDFHKMAGIVPSETSYLETSVFSMAKQRILWLMVLMVSATFTGRIIQNYNEILQSVVILASFIPMLMDTGGNAGSQSSTLIIRGLALGELELKDFYKIIYREFLISLIVGGIMALINFIRLYYIEKIDLMISLTVTLSMIFVVMIAKVCGGILPVIAKKLRLDPAIMAGPFITTIVDTLALIVYFKFAQIFILG